MIRFTLIFLLLLFSLFLLNINSAVQTHAIIPFTSGIANICASIIQIFDDAAISRMDQILNATTGVGIQIVPGCNGVEAMIILFSAIMAFAAPWLYKFKGIFWGFCAIQILNCIRIISLYYLIQWDRNWFDWFHLYLWQALIVLDALVVWLVWLRYIPKSTRASVNTI